MENKEKKLLWWLFVCLLFLLGEGREFRVGGSMGWTVPNDLNSITYNQWAESHRFHYGDSLLFVYPPEKDSVLKVNKESYNSCNTASYIKKYSDGNTVILLDRSGPFYFISGVQENCLKNESMIVVVMGERSSSNSSPSSSHASSLIRVSGFMAKFGAFLAAMLLGYAVSVYSI
ncbi:early nodulin-like protein 1 [Dioscorea cayenensis subsp. rotundata]|uniref:Early nodulin-like protein 1 n=1 Tax=Dioscorea cayennensis subsp. rotundata TaxID=55577 RepID=A0AB40AK31_DIOCR|nr:early nodulin-like protein 1 [Dioscorea cayenensis subsp. rotundata]